MRFKNILPIFYTPLYTFSFERHNELKDQALRFLSNDNLYRKFSTASHIRLSDPDLYVYDTMKPYYDFMNQCFEYVMDDLGFMKDQSITSMWATRQDQGMFHHPHKHGNTFLAGVYYLHGEPGSSGTTFINPDNLLAISPTRNFKKQDRLAARIQTDFIEGDFVVFPAWVLHSTSPNTTGGTRFILGSNSMPKGKTIDEVYDRFYYPDSKEVNMEMTPEEFERYNGISRTLNGTVNQ